MNKTTLAAFRAKLEEMCFTMVGEVKEKYKAKKDNLTEQSADIAAAAAESYNRQLMMELGEKKWGRLRLVEEAIEKIDDGRYGICSKCEEFIPEGRLILIPFATHCVNCLEILEKKTL